MLALKTYALTALAWASAHPLTALAAAVSILGTLANSLSHFPRAQAVVVQAGSLLGAILKFVVDAMAVVSHADGRGLAGAFTLPGIPTLAKKEEMPTLPRGYVTRGLLAFIACAFLLLLGCAGYWTQARKDAVGATAKGCALKLAADEWDLLKAKVVHALSTSPTDGDAKALLLAAAVDLAKSAALEGLGDAIACVSQEVAVLTTPSMPDASDAGEVVVASRSLRSMMPQLRESDVQRRARLWLEEHPAPSTP